MKRPKGKGVPKAERSVRVESAEREDLRLLAIGVVLVPATWLLLLGWSPGLQISGHDGTYITLPLVRDILEQDGDWTRFLYRLNALGGVAGHSITGSLPVYRLAGRLGLSPVACANLVTFVIQVIASFLGSRATVDLARSWSAPDDAGPPLRPGRAAQVGLAAVFAFAPVLAWRLGYGHEILVLGSFAFLATLALLLAAANGRLTVTLTAVAAIAYLHVLQAPGHQMTLYSAVFGGPVLLAVAGAWIARDRADPRGVAARALPVLLIGAGSVLASLPHFLAMFDYARGTDGGRSLGSEPVTFSYLTAVSSDWLSSIPWSKRWIPSSRELTYHHEVNFPIGPPLVLLALVPWWRRSRTLAAGLGASVLLAVVFSMNVAPASTWLAKVFPMLDSFRVPARAILPFALAVPIVAGAALLRRFGRSADGWPLGAVVGGPVVAGVLFAVSPPVREALGWLLAAGVVALPLLRPRLADALPAGALLLALAGGSLGAFRERLNPYPTPEITTRRPAQMRAEALRQEPQLRSLLTRIELTNDLPSLGTNTAYALGLSSLSGYAFPTRRFLELYFAVHRMPFDPTYVYFDFGSGPPFDLFQQLYNVAFLGTFEGKSLRLRPLGPTAGPAWFSAALVREKTVQALADRMASAGTGLHAELGRLALVVEEDDAVRAAGLPSEVSPRCAEALVDRASVEPDGQTVRLRVRTPERCPLTVAMNFASFLRGTATVGAEEVPLPLHPGYGALTQALVPAGATEVTIRPVRRPGAWTSIVAVAGFAAIGLAAFLARPGRVAPSRQRSS